MNILVTGSTGFIGKSFNQFLSKNYPRLKAYSWLRSYGKLTIENFAKQFGSELKIEKVLHLAGHTKVIESWEKPYAYLIENTELTLDTLEFCKNHKAHLVFISSYLYGNAKKMPIGEDTPIELTSPYSYGKHSSENLCRFYSDNYNLQVMVLRPFNIYGPGQDPYFLLPKIVAQVKDDSVEEISVHNLLTKRDFVFIDDFCDAICQAFLVPHQFEILNIGSGMSISVKEIIEAIFKISGKEKTINSLEKYRKNEIMNVVADISKAQTMLKWTPKTSLRDGLTKLYDEQ